MDTTRWCTRCHWGQTMHFMRKKAKSREVRAFLDSDKAYFNSGNSVKIRGLLAKVTVI